MAISMFTYLGSRKLATSVSKKDHQGKKPRTVYSIAKTGKQAFVEYINIVKKYSFQFEIN